MVIERGARIVADNALKPGAPRLVWHAARGPAYRCDVIALPEFGLGLFWPATTELLIVLTCKHVTDTMYHCRPYIASLYAICRLGVLHEQSFRSTMQQLHLINK